MADASDSNTNALVAEAATSAVSKVLSSPSVGIASPSHNPNNDSIMHPPTTSAPASTNSNDGHRSHPQPITTSTNGQTQPILVDAKSPAAAAAAATPNRTPKSRRDLCLETMDFTSMLAQHKATAGAIRDAVSSIEAGAARIEHRVKASSAAAAALSNGSDGRMMKTKDRRVVWLMMKVILRKDDEILVRWFFFFLFRL